MNYRLDLVTAPASEPITASEVKAFLRIDGSDEDALIASLITVAREKAESYTSRAFITQTWKAYLDCWPVGKGKWWDGVRQLPISEIQGEKQSLEIPMPPLQSITHIKTYDDADVASTFSASYYYVSVYSGERAQKGRVTLRDVATWPVYTRNADGIEIQFVAGYGSSASDVPTQIRQAIIQEVAYLYENRNACEQDCMCCNVAKALLNPYRMLKI